jgi:NTE family protein
LNRERWLAEGPFTLVLSAGFFGFFSHTGMLAALEAVGVRPRRIIGVSAGALAGGLWAAGLSAERIATELLALRRQDFWDPGLPLGGLLRGRKFDAELRRVIAPTGIDRVEQCPTPFVSIAHDVVGRRTLAVHDGDLATAIRASCTVPLMFRPIVWRGRVLVDGGVSDRIGRIALEPGERVLMHWIPSRSRWRRAPMSPAELPGVDAQIMVTPGVPPLGPFALADAARALDVTREHTRAWLRENA